MVRGVGWLMVIGLAIVLGYPVAATLYGFAVLPRVGSLQGPADAIVVLGGETNARVAEAASLFVAGDATRVLVSGAGDCLTNRDRLVAAGVPRDRILLDCTSSTTWENAGHAGRLLTRLHARQAIIVTSWFHVTRALACFAERVPLRFYAAPVEAADEPLLSSDTARALAIEFAKLGWYALRYGITPFGIDWGGDPAASGRLAAADA